MYYAVFINPVTAHFLCHHCIINKVNRVQLSSIKYSRYGRYQLTFNTSFTRHKTQLNKERRVCVCDTAQSLLGISPDFLCLSLSVTLRKRLWTLSNVHVVKIPSTITRNFLMPTTVTDKLQFCSPEHFISHTVRTHTSIFVGQFHTDYTVTFLCIKRETQLQKIHLFFALKLQHHY